MSCSSALIAAVMCVELSMPFVYGPPEKLGVEAIVAYTARWMAARAKERGVPGVPETLALAVAETESGFDCRRTGSAGEIGIMQIKPTTAFLLGFAGDPKILYDCETNIWYGVRYLQQAYEKCGGSEHCTISRYNRGMNTRSLPISHYTKKVSRAKKRAEGN